MATHSSILVWKIPWTEEPGRLQSIGWQRVGHNWSDLAHTHSSGTSLVVQWLRLCTFNAEDLSSIPGQGTKIPHAAWCGRKRFFLIIIKANSSSSGLNTASRKPHCSSTPILNFIFPDRSLLSIYSYLGTLHPVEHFLQSDRYKDSLDP